MSASAANITSAPSATSFAVPSDISGFVSMLLSLSALREWLKLLMVGGLIEACRRVFFSSWESLQDRFWITASFDDADLCYNWILFWLSQHPTWREARKVEVTTRNYGLIVPGLALGGENDKEETSRKTTYLPSLAVTYSIWYKRCYMTVSRIEVRKGHSHSGESLRISILSRNNVILDELISDAKRAYKAAQEHLVSIYVSDIRREWKRIASRPKRPMSSLILEPGMKEMLLRDARDFLDSQKWYTRRGIPFRRGYLLYGAPGSGKSSLIHGIAGELGLDVFIISLSHAGLDDNGLSELISELPKRCIALMEDIDAAFHRGITRERGDTKEGEQGSEGKPTGADDVPASGVSLSGLLNALDGIAAQEGRILFATTNHYTALDPALCRPGRMDVHVEFKLASRYQARELFTRFYMPCDDGADDTQEGHETAKNGSARDPPAPSVEKRLIDLDPSSPSTDASPLSYERTWKLAAQFADAVPECEFSMASLQGYLMMFKTCPSQAASEVSAWVEKECAERKAQKSGNAATSEGLGVSAS
ncbi:hypothetical protein AcV7_009314 [Taiwanofungus camphoratus]|nr:hypothetical protein AcW2_004140 [Antrodia cinnamomea]KAI0948625.1 hypothetical protein AcV7_009314 [Antrodia cinnamomea]